MIKMLAVSLLVAIAAAVGGQLSIQAEPGRAGLEQSFLTPRLDGRRLDVRYSTTTAATPSMTAERFCRAQGFDDVVGYSVQPAAATRMIGDYVERMIGPAISPTAFYAIRCAVADAPRLASRLD